MFIMSLQSEGVLWNRHLRLKEYLLILLLMFIHIFPMSATISNDHLTINKDDGMQVTFLVLSERSQEPIVGADASFDLKAW